MPSSSLNPRKVSVGGAVGVGNDGNTEVGMSIIKLDFDGCLEDVVINNVSSIKEIL